MLYWLIEQSDQIAVFNLFRYIAIRAGGAIATALVLVLFFRLLISLMDPRRRSDVVVQWEGASSQAISGIGIPAMDALTLLSVALVSTLLWANLLNFDVWIAIGAATGFGLVGFHDDYLKAIHQSHKQFSRRTRLLIETVIAIAAWIAMTRMERGWFATSLIFEERPAVFGFISLTLSTMFVVGAANAVKLMDCADRLAIVAVTIAAVVVGMVAYLTGNIVFASHLHLQYVAGTRELAVLCAAVIGACLGLVWFQASPASIFMGDTGSLALGATLGVAAVAI